jgi:hypothetical protein
LADELGIAFQKVGGTASALNVPFEKVSSYIAVVSSKTREAASTIGDGIKAIMARYQQLREKGFDESDGTQVSQVSKALASVGIQLMDSQGQFRNFGTVMDELGAKWQMLDSRHKAYLATTMAGTYQQSRFLNLMNNYDETLKLTDKALQSAGTTQQKYDLYLQGTQAHLDKLKNTIEAVWMKIFDSQSMNMSIKAVNDFIIGIGKLTENIGFLPVALGSVVPVMLMFNKGMRESITTMSIMETTGKGLTLTLDGLKVAFRGFLSATLIGAAVAALSFGIEKLTESYFNNKKAQENLEQQNKQIIKSYSEHKDEIDKLLYSYKQLDDQSNNGENFVNVEQEQKYFEITSEISKLMPNLVQSIDEKGRVHLKNADAIKKELEYTQKLVDLEKKNVISSAEDTFTKQYDSIKDAETKKEANKKLLEQKEKLKQSINPNDTESINKIDKDIHMLEMKVLGYEKTIADASSNIKSNMNSVSSEILKAFNVNFSDDTKKKFTDLFNGIKLPPDAKESVVIVQQIANAVKSLESAKQSGDSESIALATSNLTQLLGKYSDSPKDILPFINSMNGVKDATDQAKKSMFDLNTTQSEISKGIADFEKSNKELAQTYEKLAEGQNLSGKEIYDLISKYPELSSAVENHNGILTLNKEAVEAVMLAKENEFKVDLETKQQELINQEKTLTSKLSMYQSEIAAIENVATAKQALANAYSGELNAKYAKGELDSRELTAEYAKLESNFIDIGKIREQIKLIDTLKGANLGASLGASGGKPKKESKGKQDTYADKVFEALPTYKEQVEDLKNSIQSADDAVKSLQTAIEVADKADDKKKKIELENQLNQALEDRKVKYHQIAEQMRDIRDNKLLTQFDSLFPDFRQGRNMEDIGKAEFADYQNKLNEMLNDAENKAGHSDSVTDKERVNQIKSMIEQFKYLSDTVIQTDKDISDLGVKYMDDVSKIAETTKKIHEDQVAIINEGLDKQKIHIDDLDKDIEVSKARQALFAEGSKEFNAQLVVQSQLLNQKIQLEEDYQKSIQNTLDTQKDLTSEERKSLENKQHESIMRQLAEQRELQQEKASLRSQIADKLSTLKQDDMDYIKQQHDKQEKALEDNIKAVEKSYDNQIDAQEKKLKLLDDEIDKQEHIKKLNEINNELSKTINDKRTEYITSDGRKILSFDHEKVSELHKQRDELLQQYQRDDIKKAVQNEVDRLKKAKDDQVEILKKQLDNVKTQNQQEEEETSRHWDRLIEGAKNGTLTQSQIMDSWFSSQISSMGNFRGEVTNLVSQIKAAYEALNQIKINPVVIPPPVVPPIVSGGSVYSGYGWGGSSATNSYARGDSSYQASTSASSYNSSQQSSGTTSTSGYNYSGWSDGAGGWGGGAKRFASGGYTGEWGSEGKLAILDQKELVLNQMDTSNILKAVNLVRNFASNIKLPNFASVFESITPKSPTTVDQSKTIHINNPTIKADNPMELFKGIEFLITSHQG